MGGQDIQRREVLRYIGMAAVAGTFPGFGRWAFACSHNVDTPSVVGGTRPDYKLLFFSPEQFRLIDQLSELIIPEDETPGARQAGVAEFIDFMVANRVPVTTGLARSHQQAIDAGNEVQGKFVNGLNWMNAHSKTQFNKPFAECTAEQQTSILEDLSDRQRYKPTNQQGCEFFTLIREYTVVGFYTTEIGLKALGYPGLQTVWMKMPGCTHPDDPEHAHLREPAAAAVAALNILK